MKIILLRDVSGIGQRGDVKDVANGYALNALIPRGLAEHATPQKVKEHAEWQKAAEAAREKREAEGASMATQLKGASITIEVEANKTGGLYRQVTPEAISAQIKKEHGITVLPEAVHFTEPLRKVGESVVQVRLGKARADIKVSIRDRKDKNE